MLLDEALEEYLVSVESALKETLKNFYVERYEEEILAPEIESGKAKFLSLEELKASCKYGLRVN